MAIIALLTSLGAVGMQTSRKTAQVDAVAETLVTNIRQAQNNAISIKNGCGGGNSKVWGVELGSNDFYLVTKCAAGGTVRVGSSLSPYPREVTIKDSGTTSDASVYFATPFGEGYTQYWRLSAPTDWIGPNPPSQDYRAATFIPSWVDITLEIKSGNITRNVILKPTGDVYEE